MKYLLVSLVIMAMIASVAVLIMFVYMTYHDMYSSNSTQYLFQLVPTYLGNK